MAVSRAKTQPKISYQHSGRYDHQAFVREFVAQFGRSAPYNAATTPDMLVLLDHIERDLGITDVRQVAYMLTTVMRETTAPTKVSQVARNRKGRSLRDKNKQPVMVSQRKWLITMPPSARLARARGGATKNP